VAGGAENRAVQAQSGVTHANQIELFRPPPFLRGGARPWISNNAKNRNWNTISNSAGLAREFRDGTTAKNLRDLAAEIERQIQRLETQ
jgi:hypothetical protein